MNAELPSLRTAHEVWQCILGQLLMEMPRASFDRWVRDTEGLSIEEGVMTVCTRNVDARDWLESRLQSTVQRLLVGILNRSVAVQFVVQDSSREALESENGEAEQELAIEPVQWLDYDRIVQPHKQVVVKGYLRRLGTEIGPKAVWLYIGFHQAAWRLRSNGNQCGMALHSRDVMRFSGLSFGAFWRLLRHTEIQSQLKGLVQRVDPMNERRYHRGRDGRPHRIPIRYQVCMTPRLTRADAGAVHSRLKSLLQEGRPILNALQELLAAEEIMQLLEPTGEKKCHVPWNTVMDMARSEAGETYTSEIAHAAQELHRRIINCLGDIHIPHYFITKTVHRYNLTPAQAWLITVARDMAYLNSRTGERREVVTFKQGFQEMAELVGSSRYKTVQTWFNPQWKKQCRGGDMTRFLVEMDTSENTYADLRVESMPRMFRVLLDEPLDANGSHKVDANGSNSQTRMEVLADASGSNMVDASGTDLNSFKHPFNTDKKNSSNTRTPKAVAVPAGWELKALLQQNNVHPRVQRELLERNASAQTFVAWILYAASPQGRKLSDPLAYALSRMQHDPLCELRFKFGRFAALPPAELLMLIDSIATQAPEYPNYIDHPLARGWKTTMGSNNPRLTTARAILFGEGDSE